MTSNTYDKLKKNEDARADTARGERTAHRDAPIDRSREKRLAARHSSEQNRRAAAIRREKAQKAQTKPQALHTRLPAILGFDTREKFTTLAATTVNRYPLALGVAITLLLTTMFMFVVINAVSINKLKLETTQMNSHLEELIEKEAELSIELEKRDDLRYIREVALNQYGMIDKKHVTKYYISMDKDPKVEIIDNSGSDSAVSKSED